MERTFGDFKSAEELEKTAESLRAEGDLESLKTLAKENGIDEEDAEDYFNGEFQPLASDKVMALGRLEMEKSEIQLHGIFEDWFGYIIMQVDRSEKMRKAVLLKPLSGCLGALMKWSFEQCKPVDDAIVKAAGIHASVKLGIPSMAQAQEIIREYYEVE